MVLVEPRAVREARARALGHQGVVRMRAFNSAMFYGQLLSGTSGAVPSYLDTPLDVCLKRIQERNGGKAINEKLVADKIRSISSTRAKAIANGEGVLDVPYEKASAFIQKQLGWKS